MGDQNNRELAVGGASLDVLNEVLGMHGLGELEGNQEYHRNTHTAELVALTLARLHMGQLWDVIGPHGSRWLGEDNKVHKVFSKEDAEAKDGDEACENKDNSYLSTLSI